MSATKPATPARHSSVFAFGAAQRPPESKPTASESKNRQQAPAFDPLTVEIKRRPLPSAAAKKSRRDDYLTLLDRMEPGDYVELDRRLANGLRACAKSIDAKVVLRVLSEDLVGAWRVS